jgi:O-glycosyl hydrolase
LYAVPFSPPARWKDSGQLTKGGSLKRDFYRDYAEYLADFLEYYHKAFSVDIDVLSLQNEPGIAAPWPSCIWSGEQLRDFLKILAPRVRAKGLNTQFMLSEGTAWTGAWDHLKPTLDDPDAPLAEHHGQPLLWLARRCGPGKVCSGVEQQRVAGVDERDVADDPAATR